MKKAGILLLCMLVMLSGCTKEYTKEEGKIPIRGEEIEASDYSCEDNWMLLSKEGEYPVDVFYLYQTAWSQKKKDKSPLAPITLKRMREGANRAYLRTASAFETVGNIYAPYYRQMDANFVLAKDLKEQSDYFGGAPRTDALAAFDYYIQNYNQGRPFILAGHSQGSVMIKEILFDYMSSNPEVYQRMVAAYVIGYSVTEQELEEHPYLTFAEHADDTGVIISYNTEAEDFEGSNPTVLPGSIAINPISWTRGSQTARAEENLGSHIMNENRTFQDFDALADAAVNLERGTVICTTVDPNKYASANTRFYPKGVYHSWDYGFYYYNLRENAQNRVEHYLNP